MRNNLRNNARSVAAAEPALRRETQNPVLHWPEASLTDLDRVLRLISQGGAINSEVLPVSRLDLDDISGTAWINQIEKLQSVEGAPGEAANKLKSAMDDFRTAAEAYQTALRESGDAAREVRSRQEAAKELRNDPLYGIGGGELQAQIDRGGQSAIRAQEYINRVEKAQFEGFLSFAERLAAGYPQMVAATDHVHLLHARADVRRHAVVVESLLPALRERAGPDTATPELDVKYCIVPRGSARFPNEPLFYTVVHSKSAEELTRLTLLLKIEMTDGTRYATYFIPSLPPGASGRFEPVSLSNAAMRDELGITQGRPELKQARYAAWCTQFRATNQEPANVTAEELVSDVWLQASQPGVSYVSAGKGWGVPKEAKRRFELVFRKVTPAKANFAVDIDLVDHEVGDKATRYRGTMTLPPVKLGDSGQILHGYETGKFGYAQKAEDKTVLVKAQAGSATLELTLQGKWDDLQRKWQAKLGDIGFRELVPSGQVPTADSSEEKSRAAAREVRKLTDAGKFEEAKAALEQVIRDFPNTPGENDAKLMLSKLDQIQAGQTKAREMKLQREKYMEGTKMKSRGPRVPPE